jgi:Zn-dependent protease with chaperone function
VDGAGLHVRGDGLARTVERANVSITSRLASIRRVIRLPDGAQIHCDDNDAIDALFPEHATATVVDRLERHPAAVAASLVIGALAIAWFFFVGLPQIAESIAREIPPAAETLIGKQALEILDRTTLQPSTVPPETQQYLTDALRRFTRDMPDAGGYHLEFRKLPGDLPNAFAIPGGTVIVSDGLVAALPYEDAFTAVVAHEIGHQVHRHVLRHVLQGSAVIIAATLLTGDVSSATGVVLAVPTFLLTSRYSRDFEREADAYAFDALRDRGITPEWFANALRTLEARSPVSIASGGASDYASDYLSTHPASQERIDAALDAARGFEPLEVVVAKQTAAADGADTAYDAARITGCWSGIRKTDEKLYSQWQVSLGADGDLVVHFVTLDHANKVLGSSLNTGRWALADDVLAVRLLSEDSPLGHRPVDDLQTYLIDDLSEDTLDYESLDGEFHFESRRIDCSELPPAPYA